ncbi:hypothetical protein [Streptomyces sp. C8S0]|uniref:hypothetical protein n=1 Tax=Streptomyces sp. C8S0 TaxID=2585716 RepID=UPI0021F79EB4|nr:hypothetical protein [Streptomyces sp. C8S0]
MAVSSTGRVTATSSAWSRETAAESYWIWKSSTSSRIATFRPRSDCVVWSGTA